MITTEKITTTDVKRFNKNRIFRLIHYTNKISRQEIAEVLQLSLPTVNQNLKFLKEKNLINFEGSFESTGGRKAQVITVNALSKCAISVNITAASVKVALVDLNGKIVESIEERLPFKAEEIYEKNICTLINKVVKNSQAKEESILGVGITVPGVFNQDNSIILSAPTLGIKNYSVHNFTQYIPYTCKVINDARANAYAEYWFGTKPKDDSQINLDKFRVNAAEQQYPGKLYVMLNTGVGGSYIEHEKIQTGAHNRYGEFGHMTIHPAGKKCFCGKKGCFEAYVSATRLSTDLGITLKEFFLDLNENSEYQKIFEEYLDNLTTGINNLYIMSDGDVIIGGPVAEYLKQYEVRIRDILIDKYSFETDGSYFSFATCLPDESDLGAALMYLGEFITNI